MGRLWIDADPSGLTWTGLDCDDDLAILMALALDGYGRHSHADDGTGGTRARRTHSRTGTEHKLEGISICGGNAPLKHTSANAQRLLGHVSSSSFFDRDGINVASRRLPSQPLLLPRGIGWRDMNVAWRSYRLFNRLSPDMESSDDAAHAILEAAAAAAPSAGDDNNNDDDGKLTVLMLGPPSNLARALAISTSSSARTNSTTDLSKQLHHVVLMGGELTGQKMDLNFMSDRAAARTVIETLDVPTTIVPIQTCGQVVVTEEWVRKFEDRCCPRAAACALLPKMRQQVRWMPHLVNKVVRKRYEGKNNLDESRSRRWQPSPNLDRGFIPWDVLALLATARPDLFDRWEWHRASLPTCEDGGDENSSLHVGREPCHGTMLLGLGQTEEPDTYRGYVRIPHLVRNETEILDTAFLELACSIDGRVVEGDHQQPALLGGFLVTGLFSLGLHVLLVIFLGAVYSLSSSQKHFMKNRIECKQD